MSNITEYKFLIPPAVVLFFLSVAGFPMPFFCHSQNCESLALFGNTVIMYFACGFFISSIGYVFINFCVIDSAEVEAEDWQKLSEQNEFIQKQITKRWELFATNINVLVALLVVLAVLMFNGSACELGWWWIPFAIFLVSALLNACHAHDSHRTIKDHILNP